MGHQILPVLLKIIWYSLKSYIVHYKYIKYGALYIKDWIILELDILMISYYPDINISSNPRLMKEKVQYIDKDT